MLFESLPISLGDNNSWSAMAENAHLDNNKDVHDNKTYEPAERSPEEDQPEMMDHELLLDLDDHDNGNYIESLDRSKNMIDDHCSCTCSTESFDRDVRVDTAIKVLDKKLRNLPTCMKSQAYSDVLLYIRYLRRKHRKMVLRGAEKRIPGY